MHAKQADLQDQVAVAPSFRFFFFARSAANIFATRGGSDQPVNLDDKRKRIKNLHSSLFDPGWPDMGRVYIRDVECSNL